MRHLILCMIAAVVLSLPVRGSTPADRVIPLGKIVGWQVRAVVTIAPLTSDEAAACEVKVRYLLQSGRKRLLTNVMDAGESYRNEVYIGAVDFTGAGSKQLLVSTKLGGVHSHVYDLYGTHLRTLYSLEEGRVAVIARRGSGRHWDLEEEWPPLQWEDRDDLGEAHYVASGNHIARRLHWNGKAFVSYHPGPSRVVNLQDVPDSPRWKTHLARRQSVEWRSLTR